MVKKLIISLLLVLFLTAGIAYGAASQIDLGARDNGKTVKVKKGDTVTVTLEANASTGYTWDIAKNKNSVLRFKEKKYVEPSQTGEPKLGASGTEVFSFKAVRKGRSTLKLIYHRPWAKKEKPAKTFTVKIKVRKS